MPKRFDPSALWWLVWIVGAIVIVKALWVVAEWIIPLPVSGIEETRSDVRHSLHYRYRLASDAQVKAPVSTGKKRPVKKAPKASLAGYSLVGIYSLPDYAVVTLVKGGKSFVLSTDPKGGGEVEGFHLTDANATEAHFQKGQMQATLRLSEKKLPRGAISSVSRRSASTPKPVTRPSPSEKKEEAPIVQDEDGTRRIDRTLIREFSENPDKIWKNIGLYEVKHDGKLDGFKVRFVRRGSPFDKLGLKRGDIIKAINGEPIVDYATPMRMLRSADTIDELSITIDRNHEEQELKYEVK